MCPNFGLEVYIADSSYSESVYSLHLRLVTGRVSVRPGGLVGERPPAAALPPLVSLRLLPETPGRRAAPPSGHPGGEALRHRGAGRPGHRLLHPGLGAVPHAHEHKVRRPGAAGGKK